ncbi:MAG TPA: DHH family phosphoesterase, partial [Candidatus Peribacteraceae bacterium]|nr:DHH family phosphoesterase [Candidatus Peribacteraceae bacterium]
MLLREERGLTDGGLSELTSPMHLHDMERAVLRIRRALEAGERIAIFGDYDCDGITATAQLVRFFRRHGLEPLVRLPHRVRDGYGLGEDIIDEFIAAKVKLLITVDTGIGSAVEIEKAKAADIDVIVTDHHHVPARRSTAHDAAAGAFRHAGVPAELPPAFALVHPSLSRHYPTPHPSGAGVAFQLVRALEEKAWPDVETDIALAMIGTIADLVELRGDNRTLVRSGLRALAKLQAGPLRELLSCCDLEPTRVSSTDIAFRVAPRLNAAGRIADADLALAALLEGGEALQEICTLNTERQQLTEEIFQMAAADLQFDGQNFVNLRPLLASAHEEYPHGIIGLIAGRLTEQSGRPSLLGTFQDELCVASLRSPPTYHIAEGLERCAHLLERFGGHAQAAGCTLRREHWPELCRLLEADVIAQTKSGDLHPTLEIDGVLSTYDITFRFLESLAALEPFGQGNREPLFLLRNVKLDSVRCVGREQNHLQARIGNVKTVGFRLGHLYSNCAEVVDIVCRLGIDTWQGAMQPQVFMIDCRNATTSEAIPKSAPAPLVSQKR